MGICGYKFIYRERLITAGSQDRTVRLWKVPEDSHLIFNGYSSCVSIDCVALINENHFVSGSADGLVELSFHVQFDSKIDLDWTKNFHFISRISMIIWHQIWRHGVFKWSYKLNFTWSSHNSKWVFIFCPVWR